MAPWAVAQGYGRQEDVSVMEEGGRLASADADLLSDRALERGLKQVGTLGSGNHFLETDTSGRNLFGASSGCARNLA